MGRLAIATGLVAALVLAPKTALAAACGEFWADASANVIVYGEVTHPELLLPRTGELGVCWLADDGQWHFEHFPACDEDTPGTDTFVIHALGGDDIVVPAVRDGDYQDFICQDYAQFPAPFAEKPVLMPMYRQPGDGIHPRCVQRDAGCVSALPFGVEVYGGTGSDEIHGTPGDDALYSNVVEEICFSWPGFPVPICVPGDAPGDDDSDVLCAYGGEDYLRGDEAAVRPTAVCMDGGYPLYDPATDTPTYPDDVCQGSNNNIDRANELTCRTVLNAGELPEVGDELSADACCWERNTPGCAPHWSDHVEQCVCTLDPYCCNVKWDWICQDEVESACGFSCSGDFYNGCYDVCQHQIEDPLPADDSLYIVPPLHRILAERHGPDWPELLVSTGIFF